MKAKAQEQYPEATVVTHQWVCDKKNGVSAQATHPSPTPHSLTVEARALNDKDGSTKELVGGKRHRTSNSNKDTAGGGKGDAATRRYYPVAQNAAFPTSTPKKL